MYQWIYSLSITVKNVMKIYKTLMSVNVNLIKPLKSIDGSVMMTYCKTPEGAYLEIVEIK